MAEEEKFFQKKISTDTVCILSLIIIYKLAESNLWYIQSWWINVRDNNINKNPRQLTESFD